MAWTFQTDPDFQRQLDQAKELIEQEIYPLETLDIDYDTYLEAIRPLQARVKKMGLWAAHLPPELGGMGYGQVRLGLLNEVVGRSFLAPVAFGNNAPDSGNAELIAVATEQTERTDQREKWLYPLLDGKLRSGFSMTEPGNAGSDPTLLEATAVKDGGEWVINGHKWFTTNGSISDFLIVMCVTNPHAGPYNRCSMIIVPTDTPGVHIVRDVPTMEHPHVSTGSFWGHTEIVYENVRVPLDNLLGIEGDGFKLAQARLGPGRIHHAMRWLGQAQRAFDMLCERAVSRYSHGSYLSEKQMVQDFVAQSMAEITSSRLLTLYAAWKMDMEDPSSARVEIAMIKYHGAATLYNVIDRAIQVHGGLGFSSDMPLEAMYRAARAARIYDGADEVHKASVARRVLRRYQRVDVPTEHIPTRREAAQIKFADLLAKAISDD
ncbi:MAG: acyl-CoA dehydrogenase family protein [Actinobacteria bacterium]|nr:acyl-CoA dehydrogenase family protein [Actinomycetota bacterium]MCL5885573.1 acyl-CoA dehydrogenase family protein [Actinomycetota bacterium]